jgi:hypothetical protein
MIPRFRTLDGDDVKVAGSGVVAAVHHGTAVLPLAFIPVCVLFERFAGGGLIRRSDRIGTERTLGDRESS